MAFIPVPNVIQAELVYTWNNETCENVLHFESAGAPSIPNMQELGAYLVAWWTTSMKPLTHNSVQLVNVKLTDLNAAFAPAIDYTTTLPQTGTPSGDSMPNNVSLVMSKRTVFRGRSYRGRIYVVGLFEPMVAGNVVTGSHVTNLKTAWSLLNSFATTSESWTHVVVSRFEGGAPRAFGVTTPVINITSDGIVDSQRRRLPGRGT